MQLEPQPIGKETINIDKSPSTLGTGSQQSLENTREASITSHSKITETTTTSQKNIAHTEGDGQLRLRKFLMNAGAIKNEIDDYGNKIPDKSRSQILDSLKRPISNLQNNRVKLRGAEGENLTTKNRSFFSISSKIGGTKSNDAVKNLLSQLETASKLPSDDNSPSVVNILDQLLNSEWVNKTIAHDTPGDLKNQFLDILANEVISDPTISEDQITRILSKLDVKTALNEKTNKLNNKLSEHANNEVKKTLSQLEKNSKSNNYREIQYIPNELENLLDNKWFNNAIAQDTSGKLKNQFLDILANEVIQDPGIKSKEINIILSKLTPNTNMSNKVNEFEEKLVGHAIDLVQERKCEGSDNFIKQYNEFESIYLGAENEMSESFLNEYHKLLKVMEPNELEIEKNEKLEMSSYKDTFGSQFANTHEEAMQNLNTHYYVVEKTDDKFFYHIDLFLDGKREIRSKEISEADAKDPKLLKEKLDAFINKVSKDKLNPKGLE